MITGSKQKQIAIAESKPWVPAGIPFRCQPSGASKHGLLSGVADYGSNNENHI